MPARLFNNGARTEWRLQGDYDLISAVVGVTTQPTCVRDLDTHLGVRLHHFGRGVLVA